MSPALARGVPAGCASVSRSEVRSLARDLEGMLPDGVGFVLVVFDEGGHMHEVCGDAAEAYLATLKTSTTLRGIL
jgi:hypothetical protein